MNFSDRSYKQYLAVAPFPSSSHSPEIGAKAPRPFRACIQIWSLSPSQEDVAPKKRDDNGEMKCEMVLCLDGGPAYKLRWCPLPSHDLVSSLSTNKLIAEAFYEFLVSLLNRISLVNSASWLGRSRMVQFRFTQYPNQIISLLMILHQDQYMVRI